MLDDVAEPETNQPLPTRTLIHRTVRLLVLLLVVLAACSDSSGPPDLTVASVTVSGNGALVVEGSTVELSATAYNAKGKVLTGQSMSWSSSNAAVATVSSSGVVTCVSAGNVTITASTGGKTGELALTVLEAAVADVTVTSPVTQLIPGATAQLAAVAKDAGGHPLVRTIVWSSSNTGIATVSADGLVTAVAGGSVTINASAGGKTGQASITVTQIPVASVTVSAASSEVTAGGTLQLSATPRDANGGVLSGRVVSWASSDSMTASVSSSGLLTAKQPGIVTVTATSEGKAGQLTIAVTEQPVASVTISAPATSLIIGATVQLAATVLDQAGAVLNRQVAWSSSDNSVATISATGLVTAVATGSSTITAASGGKQALVVITVSAVPVASISISAPASDVAVGATLQLAATTRDASGNALLGRSVTWSVSNTSIATVTTSGLLLGVAPGTVTITASSEGQSTQITINVLPTAVASVAITAPATTILIGGTVQLSAVAVDADGAVLTGRIVTWSTSDANVATVTQSGLVSGVSAGSAAITATIEGKSAQIIISVSVQPVATVVVSASATQLTVAATLQLSAATLDSAGNALNGRTVTWSSSNNSIATVSATGLVTGIGASSVTITASSEGKSGHIDLTVLEAPVATVTINAPATTIVVNGTVQFMATTSDAAGHDLIGRAVTWSSSDSSIASVSATGLVTGLTVGTATITATSEGKTADVVVTVTAQPVASVSVSAPASQVAAGGSLQLTAQAYDANGALLSGRQIFWATSDAAIATITSTGLLRALQQGTVTITATCEGKSGNVVVTVLQAPVASLTIDAPFTTLTAGATVQLSARTLDEFGNVLTGRAVTWLSSDTSVAKVSGNGLVTAVAPGNAVISASSEGITGQVVITVSLVPVASVTVSGAASSVFVGSTLQLTATTRDANGAVLTGRAIFWSSSNTAIARVDSTGLVTGEADGTVTITAISEGQVGTFALTVQPAPVATITINTPAASLTVGSTAQLSAVTRDANGNILTGRVIAWSSSDSSIATISSTGLLTAVALGSATITATSEGKSDHITLTVTNVPVVSVTVTAPSTQVIAGSTLQLTAVARDAGGNVLANRVITYATSDATIATVSATGLVTGVAPGGVTITASSEGKSGQIALTVLQAPVASVLIDAPATSIFVGSTVQLSATTKSASGGVLTGRIVTWASSDNSKATVSSTGLVNGVAPGTVTITATSEGVSSQVSITVLEVPVATVTITTSSTSLAALSTLQLTATPRDANGNVLTGRTIIWSSSNNTVATVSSTGLVTGVATGSVTITASSGGQSGQVVITVTPPPVATVSINAPASDVIVGQTLQLTAVMRDANGNVLSGRAVTWSVDIAAIAMVSASGLVTGVAPGTAVITASSEGKSAQVAITVLPVPVAAVNVSAPATQLYTGTTLQLTATVLDGSGNVLTGRVVNWVSSNTAAATVSSSGLVTALTSVTSPTTVNIIATSEGKSGQVSLSVVPAPVATVTISGSSNQVFAGFTLQLSAVTRDANGNVLANRPVTWASNNNSVASVAVTGLVTGITPGTATITATSEGHVGQFTVTVVQAPVASVTVTAPTSQLNSGSSMQLTATPRDANGTPLSGRVITWSSSNTALATVSSTGLVSALATVQTTSTVIITATSEGQSGQITLTIVPAPVATININAPATEVVSGQTLQLSAVTRDANGNVLTGRSITWESSSAGIASVSSSGLVTGVTPGSATITAMSEGKSAQVVLTVLEVPVASVTVTAPATDLNTGTTLQLTATLRDASGNVLTGRPVTWVSSNTTIAIVSSSGLVTGISTGSVTITATSGSQSGQITLNVTPAPVATVTINAPATTLFVGATVQLSATTKDANGNVLTGRAVSWSTSDPTVATVTTSGLVTGLATGSAVITATSEGQSGQVTISVSDAPVATVSVTAPSTQLEQGSTLQLTATLRDASGNLLAGRPVSWLSSNTSVATVSASGEVAGLAPGTVTVTATSEGKTGQIVLSIVQPAVASVFISAPSTNVVIGTTVQFSATLSDRNGNLLTGRTVVWASLTPSVATVTSNGAVTGVALGPATITATSEGQTGAINITVVPIPVASVTVSSPGSVMIPPNTLQMSVTLRDANGNILTGRTVTWSSTSTGIATVSSSGLVTAVTPGTTFIRATSEGVTGQVQITVNAASMTISVPSSQVQVGSKLQLTATIYDANGAVLPIGPVAWSSSNTAVATVDITGVLTAVATGTTTITGTSAGTSAQIAISVLAVPVANVIVSGSTDHILERQTLQLTATALDSSNAVLSGRTFTWSSSDSTIATVSQTGLVTGVQAGTVAIRATTEGVTGQMTVTIQPIPVASVTVTSPVSSIIQGDSVQMTATVKDANGNTLTGRLVTWASSNTSVATVSNTGLVRGIAPGTVAITATSEGKVGQVTLTVNQIPAALVVVSSPFSRLPVGQTMQFTATVYDASGNVLTGRSIRWQSSSTNAQVNSSTGLVSGVAAGDVTITACTPNCNGTNVRGTKTITVYVRNACQDPVDVLTLGSSVAETLSSADCITSDSTYADVWQLNVSEQAGLQIDMTSTAFDAYVVLQDSTRTNIAADDDGGSNGNARIVVTLNPGRYYILANTVTVGATGAYQLSVQLPVAGSVPANILSPMIVPKKTGVIPLIK